MIWRSATALVRRRYCRCSKLSSTAVSYTHLDVYKRQAIKNADSKNNVGLQIRLSESTDSGGSASGSLTDLTIHEENQDNRGRKFGRVIRPRRNGAAALRPGHCFLPITATLKVDDHASAFSRWPAGDQ